MTEELAERYEELHLIYGVDQHVRRTARSSRSSRACSTAAPSRCASTWSPSSARARTCACRRRSRAGRSTTSTWCWSRCAATCSASCSRRARSVVLNDADDPRRAYVFTDMPYKMHVVPGAQRRHGQRPAGAAQPRRQARLQQQRPAAGRGAGQPAVEPHPDLHAGQAARHLHRADRRGADRGGRGQGPVHPRPQRAGAPHLDGDRPRARAARRRAEQPVLGLAAARCRQDRHSRRGAVQAVAADARTSTRSSWSTPSAATRSCATSTT